MLLITLSLGLCKPMQGSQSSPCPLWGPKFCLPRQRHRGPRPLPPWRHLPFSSQTPKSLIHSGLKRIPSLREHRRGNSTFSMVKSSEFILLRQWVINRYGKTLRFSYCSKEHRIGWPSSFRHQGEHHQRTDSPPCSLWLHPTWLHTLPCLEHSNSVFLFLCNFH